ncbi:hypothetical protein D3C76_1205510 [compost metagenome]
MFCNGIFSLSTKAKISMVWVDLGWAERISSSLSSTYWPFWYWTPLTMSSLVTSLPVALLTRL